MTGPCMCGDIYCHSCGPAQGNHQCSNCGIWSADGGCEDPEVCAKENREADNARAEELRWLEENEKLDREEAAEMEAYKLTPEYRQRVAENEARFWANLNKKEDDNG